MSVRHALLALLCEGPKYGLQLREEFEAGTGEVWPLNIGQVYTTLRRLERDGLVESDDAGEDGPQKGFRITADGEQELAGWLRTPPDLSSPPRDELVIKVLVALRVPGVEVAAIVQAHRKHLIETMSRYTRLKEDAAEDDIGLLEQIARPAGEPAQTIAADAEDVDFGFGHKCNLLGKDARKLYHRTQPNQGKQITPATKNHGEHGEQK